jgi:hypothetical protein
MGLIWKQSATVKQIIFEHEVQISPKDVEGMIGNRLAKENWGYEKGSIEQLS